MILRRILLACAAIVATGALRAADAGPMPPGIETGPAMGWVFPVFTDKEGYHFLTLRGTSARALNANEIEVTGFSAVQFTGDATERVETILISPKAIFYPKQNRAAGDSAIRLIHDDVEVNGAGWTYDRNTKKVSLAHDVRVTFQAQLNDILK